MNVSGAIPYRQIDHTWSTPPTTTVPDEPEYLGLHGTGVLHEEFGDGEYLDTQAIKMAHIKVAEDLPETNIRYLPIKELTLMNFVIDSGPVLRWLDPEKLEQINLREGCIDAGFHLSDDMKHVRVHSPKPPVSMVAARTVKRGELKVVELRKGKVMSRNDANVVKHESDLKEQTLRHKLSQLLPKMSKKDSLKRNKENKPVSREADKIKVLDVGHSLSD